MGRENHKIVLFLCTGNYYRSRFAEYLFNSAAARLGLPWKADSRGLALERGVNNVGPMAPAAIKALQELKIQADGFGRFPQPATPADFEAARLVIALKDAEHRPLMVERFPAWADKIEYWHVEDDPHALTRIEPAVMTLLARLFSGKSQPMVHPPAALEPPPPVTAPAAPAASSLAGKKQVVRVGRETKGRRGKGVTTVFDLPLDETGVAELAALLKQRCGTGGSVKDGRIEIQGDLRDRVTAELETLGFVVKRVGG